MSVRNASKRLDGIFYRRVQYIVSSRGDISVKEDKVRCCGIDLTGQSCVFVNTHVDVVKDREAAAPGFGIQGTYLMPVPLIIIPELGFAGV